MFRTAWTSCLECCRRRRIRHDEADGTSRREEQLPVLVSHQTSVTRKDYESLDYDRFFNKPYEDLLERQRREHSEAKLGVIKWIVTFVVGFLTGMVALYIDVLVKLLTSLKFSTVDNSINSCSNGGCLAVSLLWLLLFNVGFVVIASCLTVYEPVAGGSGIPEIKSYLNGVKIPNMVRLHTLIAKSVGVLFSVAGGLFVGKEGPMIHSGAIIGAGVPQFQSLAFKKINFKYSIFRTDRDKRDFVSGGAAAGVAAAFGAPIGGVLFSLEEGSSFWNQKLTWRTFFCSMSATFTLNFFLSGIDKHSWGFFYLPGLIDFGEFKCHGKEADCRLWNAVDLFIFVLIGLIGGLLGAIFNTLNSALTVFRMKHVHKKHKICRILEAMLVATMTTTITFVASMTLGECRKIPTKINGTETIEGSVRTYFCKDGYYNDMATLFFNSQEVGIKQLFHQSGTFSMPTLGISFLVFFFLACWTYGVAVPSGLFVPSLFCGAAYGRFIANLLENYIGYDAVYSGTFALIGAAAFLGGVVRMTISLTVILIESTNEISYGLPLMLTLMVAKWAGDVFNEGLYDIHIALKGVPLLEWEVSSEVSRLKARDIMDRKLVVLFPKTRVASLLRILKTTVHNAFPVVTMAERSERDVTDDIQNDLEFITEQQDRNVEMLPRCRPMQFVGIILRSHLVVLIQKGAWQQESPSANQCSDVRILDYEELTGSYPRYPNIHDVDVSNIDPEAIVDVGPYVNACPYTVFPDTSVPQVFNLFRSMGLRHLPVVGHDGKLCGIITRHNLTHEYLHDALHRQQHLGSLNGDSAS